MKPFDLEAAKAGAPLVTRDGRAAKFIAHVGEAYPSQRLLALVNGDVHIRFDNGQFGSSSDGVSDNDLLMAPVKRTVWINLYERGQSRWHDTEEDADDCARGNRLGGRAWPIEIEE